MLNPPSMQDYVNFLQILLQLFKDIDVNNVEVALINASIIVLTLIFKPNLGKMKDTRKLS